MARISPMEIAGRLHDTDSTSSRSSAIVSLCKALRRADRFQPAWDAVGGAAGLASLMTDFSVRDVRYLCRRLGGTASAEKARPERRAALSELVRLLYNDNKDDRPLRAFYQDIVPGCSLEVVQEWERNVQWTPWQQLALSRGHSEREEERFLAEIFSSSPNANFKFETERRVFRGNWPLCEKVLLTIQSIDGAVRIPPDFVKEFAMPILNRLVKKKRDTETKNKYLGYVIQCVQKHPDALADQLNIHEHGLIHHVIRRWKEAPAGSVQQQQMKAHLTLLLELLPAKAQPLSVDSIYRLILQPQKLDVQQRYELLQLVLRHVTRYSIVIDDDSAPTIAHLRSLRTDFGLWPATIFFYIGIEHAMPMFEKLVKAYPNGDFLSPSNERTVMKQTRSPDDDKCGDIEIVRCILIRKSSIGSGDFVWLNRVRLVVEERKKRAQSSRESEQRAFWAKSAMRLSISTGDPETFHDTVMWARRFNKDPLTVRELYGRDTLETEEAEDLLGAIPRRDSPSAVAATPESFKRDVDITNRILVNLFETAAMTVQEPAFDRSSWLSLLRLPKVITDRRLKNVDVVNSIMESSPSKVRGHEIADILWKPSMDALIEIEALLYTPASKALLGIQYNVEVSGTYILWRVYNVSASLLADLARFLLQQMRARLGPERLKVQIGSVVDIILRVANSDQPTLACPFIRDLIMDGDDNSSWYRRLVNIRYLSSLPPKAAKEFLYTMADAMRDKMREQNSWPRGPDENKPRAAAIKITTIKMLAEVLQNNLFIDAVSSCDILVGLLAETRHIDARVTILSSLISLMEVPLCPPKLRIRILDALQTHIVPAAAQLSERRPLTEADWAEAAGQGGVLPDIGEETPLLNTLLAQADNEKLNANDKGRLLQLIIDALEQSATNNARWMDLFLSKNNLALGADEHLPVAPVNPKMLQAVLKGWTSYMPISLFAMLRDIVLTNLDPSPGIARVTAIVKGDPNIINSNAGKHWLRQFDNPGYSAFWLGLSETLVTLQRPMQETRPKLKGTEAVTIQAMQKLVLSATELLVMKGNTDLFTILVSNLCRWRFEGREHWKSWQLNCVPLIQEIIGMIDTMRLSKKGDEVDISQRPRSPLVLPNTFHLSIKMLPIPYATSQQPASEEDIDVFISELSGFIDRLATRRLPYHEDFARLKEEVLESPRTADLAKFALKLARLADVISLQEPALADYLRLELAGDLLIKAGDPMDKEVARDTRKMVSEWKQCKAEGLTAMGLSVEGKLKGQKKTWAI